MKRAIIIGAVFAMLACGRGYSDGERAGTVFKFSNKGVFMKSWEGGMNLGGALEGQHGAVPNVWTFTVTDPLVVPQIQQALESGEPIRLKYVEWFKAGCSMDTDYEVTAVIPTKK